jgi:L-alanine-DL-glutamate epimerase-like enolase superfamily enzyme
VQVPQGPGLGIEIDQDGLAEIMARPWENVRG